MAVHCAHVMLPEVFRAEHPAFAVPFAREHRASLEALLEALPAETFTASDALGWVYQFWQSKRKHEVNRSEAKVGADELPAVTQLFTEPYMVAFLLDNGLGAWWAARRLSETDFARAKTEEDLRRRASIERVPLDYLRFVREDHDPERLRWRIAAGEIDAWPETLSELKMLDPCCGSGHFLVAAFNMLVPMRMEAENLTAREAIDAVLRDNLHGLELDARCVEIAAFALALAAWRYPAAGGYRPLPPLKLACSGLAVGATRKRWMELAPTGERNLRTAFGWLHDTFRQGPLLGSLLDPAQTEAARAADWQSLAAVLRYALKNETSDEHHETAIAAQGIAKAAELLTGRYHWIVTNVPYLARGRQGKALRDFCDKQHPQAKRDLATVFLMRCLMMCTEGGLASLVLPQNWLFLATYRTLRENLLTTARWRLLARLGPGAFDTITGEVVKSVLLAVSRQNPAGVTTALFDQEVATDRMFGMDVARSPSVQDKACELQTGPITSIAQLGQLENPDARVTLKDASVALLDQHANSYQGIKTGDDAARKRCFWEQPRSIRWENMQSTVRRTLHFDGLHFVLDWEHEGRDMARRQGVPAWGRRGVAISQMGDLPVAVFLGATFDSNVSAVTTTREETPAVWCFCSSPEYNKAVRQIDQNLKVTNATLVKVPFDVDYWTQVATERYPHGLPEPYTNEPTQWIFHGHPCGSVIWDEEDKRTYNGPLRTDETVLQVAVARLLGYRWPAELDATMELADEQRVLADRCAALLPKADDDGIVCIPAVRGEPSASERLVDLLAGAYGEAWDDDVSRRLLADVGAKTFGEWLRNRFFEQHCALFHHRPFVWHVWDGRRRDGFHALINYHKLSETDGAGQRLLNSLTHSYLGEWISRQRDGVRRNEAGAEDRLTAALELRRRLVAILEGEPPHDLFVRWKPIREQPIGWEPDINDGVRINIRPFLADDIPGGRKGAGILRTKPNIHWRKDRGKEPFQEGDGFPWYWADGKFTGHRVNDLHFTLAEKRAARQVLGWPRRVSA